MSHDNFCNRSLHKILQEKSRERTQTFFNEWEGSSQRSQHLRCILMSGMWRMLGDGEGHGKGGGQCLILEDTLCHSHKQPKPGELKETEFGKWLFFGLALLWPAVFYFDSERRHGWASVFCCGVGCKGMVHLVGYLPLFPPPLPHQDTPWQVSLQSSLTCSHQPTSELFFWGASTTFLVFVQQSVDVTHLWGT